MKECPACRRCFPDDINHCPQDGDVTTHSLLGEPILDARYQLERRLGQGGMGVVFQARHIFLKTAHAIKVILPDLVGNDPMLVTRFRQEALAAAAIRHQNIIAVTDFGVVRGTMPFLGMEFVNGKSLQDMLAEEGVMPPARALEIISAIGAGVAAAHKQNIVHRDLKPLNIMAQNNVPISEGLKILDFGLAKIKSGELLGSFVQAKTSGLMGSPFYMAPEQWSDDEPDSRADIYSLGIILYQMLAGDVPFKGSSIPSIMKKHLTLPPASFQSLGIQVPPRIEAVVRHALEKEVETRIPTVGEFLSDLRAAVNSSGAPAPKRRETGSIDPNKTFVSPLSPTTTPPGTEQTNVSEPAFDSMAGTINSAALEGEVREEISTAAEAHRWEQEQRDRVAREEIARESEARRAVEAERIRKQKEEENRLAKEKADREEQERRHREQLDRVARQASDLEERLSRLATSMPPPTGVIDPEVTQISQKIKRDPVGNNSFSGDPAVIGRSQQAFVEVAPKPKINPLLFVGAAVVAILLVGGVIGAYVILKPNPSPPINNNQGQPTPTPKFKADLVEIPGGTFQMGRNDGTPQERPQHPVTVQTFLMDRAEVTNEEYAEFVRDKNYEPPSHWLRGKPLPLQEKWPVVNVSPRDAEAFAAWRSSRDGVVYRLPTEEEWEYAARSGGDYKAYPWGDRWEDGRAVVKEADAKPVGSFPEGANRWGVVDLIGNVWEWTSSKASLYQGNTAGQIPTATKEWVVARGGSYSSDPNDRQIPISATYRDWFDPTLKHPSFGFRLVRAGQ
ncbi:MAG: SUMF1/EgtB/PvdO family nonheme iron enzyme [Pyrinomonadaceae bacterium]|nr:SUMF1/EgtB/PvdO family nonheme iron enzyme [Pyrinomonadaceae bacterium]